MSDPIDPERVYDADTAAALLLLTAEHTRSLCKSGDLPAADVSRNPGNGRARWRIRGASLLAFLEARTAGPKPPPTPARRTRRQPAGVREFYPASA